MSGALGASSESYQGPLQGRLSLRKSKPFSLHPSKAERILTLVTLLSEGDGKGSQEDSSESLLVQLPNCHSHNLSPVFGHQLSSFPPPVP